MPADVPPTSVIYEQALSHFRERQPLIESYVWGNFKEEDLPQVVLGYWNVSVGRNIIGALTLGSMSFLGNDLQWARELLINYELSFDKLRRYLTVYHRAARENLDEAGQVVLDWFAQQAVEKV
jgi:hypothetical protein